MLNKIIRLTFFIVLTIIAISTISSNVYAVTISNLSAYGITWNGTKVGHFEIDGRVAFCVDHSKTTPGTGVEYGTGEVYNNAEVRKILYYGWGGPGQWSGFNGNEAKGIVITTMKLNKHFNGDNRSFLAEFESFLASQPDPIFSTNFSNRNLTASISGNKQVTNQTTITGSDRIQLKFNLQDNVTIVCDNRNWSKTGGEVTVSVGDVIHFEAPLNITGNWTSSNIANSVVFQSLIYTSSNSKYQRIARAGEFEVDPGSTTNITINWVNTGNIEIHKKDSVTGKAIANTTFNIKGNGIDTNVTTDINGIARLNNIPLGTYQVTETISNSNYEIDTTVKTLEVEPGKTTTKEIGNKHVEGELELIKVDKDNENIKIQGAKFELFSVELNKVVATGVTDTNGKIIFNNIRTGEYKVYEVEANEWYKLDSTQHSITIKKNETSHITVKNQLKTGHIKIEKIDKDYTNIKLSGAVFEIYNSKGTKVDTLTTGNDGTATSKELPLKETYTVKEVKAPLNYRINTKETTVTFTSSDVGKTKTVTYDNKHDEGELEILKVNKLDETMKIEGVKFELWSIELNKIMATGTTNKEGKLKFTNIRTGEYLLYEVEANEWYRLDTTKKTTTIKKDETTYITIKNQPKMGYIAIEKYDQDYTDKKLAGAVFEIYNSKGQKLDTITTNEQGRAKSKALPIYETYTVKEVKVPVNYYINKKETTVKYNSSEDEVTKNAAYPEKRHEGNLKVYKVDDKNQKIALGNVEFDLYSHEFNKVIGTFYTDVNGEILVENLRVGNYSWIEKTTNKWYDLAENTEVEVIWNTTVETTILNKLKQGRIKVVKVDKDNNEILLAGVKFQVIDDKGNVLETIVTNEMGEAITAEYPVRDFENLSLKEIETLKEYKLNDEVIQLTLKANETVVKTVENEVKKGQIKIVKVDKDNNEIKLEGVIFEVLNEKGEIVETLITDKNGEAITKRLPITSTYIVREKETLKEYKLNMDEIKVKLQEDEIKTLTFANELKKAQIKVIKVDKENHKIKLKDVQFEVYNSKGELVDTIITNEKGEAITKKLPINDTYSLKEVKTDKYYKLNTDITIIDLTKYIDNYEENIIESITIENQIKKGQVKVVKVDKDNNKIKLEGVTFEVLDETGKVVDTLVTNANGEATSIPLRINQKYTLKEIKTQEIYELNEELIIVELEDNKITNKTITNELKKAQIKVIKVDKENYKIKLKDVEFEVYNSNGELVDIIITNENGEAVTKRLPVNDNYSLKEVKTDKYYKLNTDITIIDLTKYIGNYEKNIVEATIIENQVKKGKIKVIKTDGDTKIPLEDIVFEVYDEDNNLIETIITDENGEATTKELPINKHYILIEKETQKGYQLSNKEETLELTEDEITSIEFKNYKEKGKIKIVKTSSNGKVDGFSFKITGMSITGEEIEMIVTTDKTGIILIDDILVGEYTIEEIWDESYEKTEPQTVNIKNGETAEVSFYNKLIETDTPQTGDERSTMLWTILLATSITLLLSVTVYKIVKKRKRK